jgi:hypothetical protein
MFFSVYWIRYIILLTFVNDAEENLEQYNCEW